MLALTAGLIWLYLFAGQGASLFAALNAQQVAEYELKSAFIYNFLKFTQWPKEYDKKKDIVIGIFDPDVYAVCDKVLRHKTIDKKQVQTVQLTKDLFKDKEELNKNDQAMIKQMQECHILFIPESQKIDLKALKTLTGKLPILLVGEEKEFLERGGMINFLILDKKVRFEINLIETDKAAIQFRSQLLRLAVRVIEKKEKDQEQ